MLIIEGVTENVSQFIIPLISKKVFSKEQKLLEHGRMVKTISNLYNNNIFVFETVLSAYSKVPSINLRFSDKNVVNFPSIR